MVNLLLKNNGFEIRSYANFGRWVGENYQKVWMNFEGVGKHQWYFEDYNTKDPIAIKDETHFKELIDRK